MKTGIVLLAAGSSSRLGRPKQLIEFEGKTLLQKAIDEAQQSRADALVVVLGWNPELIQTSVDLEQVEVVINPDWKMGMTSSMQAGLRFLIEKENPDQVILMLCDQPFVDANMMDRLIIERQRSGKAIVASSYSQTLGVPVLFGRHFFDEIFALKGSEGAKNVIFDHLEDVSTLCFPLGEVDLDTEEDLTQLKKRGLED